MKRTSIAILLVLLAGSAHAACMNKFVARSEGGTRQVVTLLTGKMTFAEAQAIADSAKVEWVDEKGKAIGRQFGKLKIVRPMPVGCDGRSSGVVMVVTFVSASMPVKKMNVRFDPSTTVEFEQQ